MARSEPKNTCIGSTSEWSTSELTCDEPATFVQQFRWTHEGGQYARDERYCRKHMAKMLEFVTSRMSTVGYDSVALFELKEE